MYNKKGLVSKVNDISSETTIYYTYDFSGNKIGEYRQKESGDLSYQIDYDANGNKVEKTSVNGTTKTITTGTDSDGNSFVSNDGITVKTESDDFNRTEKTKLDTPGNNQFLSEYEYCEYTNDSGTHLTNRISKIIQSYNNTDLFDFEYTYDNVGNIKTIKENGTNRITCNYDGLNQLVDVKDTVNNNITFYSYDDGGNITNVLVKDLDNNGEAHNTISSVNYTYDTTWKDKLTAYDGQPITYDAMGNPLEYRDGMTFTWENGRWLSKISKGNSNYVMQYDINGLRTKKGTTKYYYDTDNNLIAMVASPSNNNTLLFYYDSDNNPTAFQYNDTMYYYVKNIQGDIIRIVNENGTTEVTYDYDAWGRILSVKNSSGNTITPSKSNLAGLNPFRYRGYVFDDETGLYYLQSRYYDPKTGRFLNADTYFDTATSILGTNCYAYSDNNPINKYDISGKKSSWILNGFLGKWYKNSFWDIYDGYFYYGNSSPQWFFGYCNLYDSLSKYAFMNLQWIRLFFNYNNKLWRIEIWKGIYGTLNAYFNLIGYYGRNKGLFYGSEIGLYYMPSDWYSFNGLNPKYGWIRYLRYKSGIFDSVNKKDYQYMSMKMYYKGKLLYSRTTTTWWLTAFKYQLGDARPSDLTLCVWIKFNTKKLRDIFFNELKKKESIKEKNSYIKDGYKVYFKW